MELFDSFNLQVYSSYTYGAVPQVGSGGTVSMLSCSHAFSCVFNAGGARVIPPSWSFLVSSLRQSTC